MKRADNIILFILYIELVELVTFFHEVLNGTLSNIVEMLLMSVSGIVFPCKC